MFYFWTWAEFPTDQEGLEGSSLGPAWISPWPCTHSSQYSLELKFPCISTAVLLSCSPENSHLGTAFVWWSWWWKTSIHTQQPEENPLCTQGLLHQWAHPGPLRAITKTKTDMSQIGKKPQSNRVNVYSPSGFGKAFLRWQLQQLKPVLLEVR